MWRGLFDSDIHQLKFLLLIIEKTHFLCVMYVCCIVQSVANNNLYCFDGNFGLVRRKTAGIQSAFPRHQERFFCNQVEVDKFMNDYSEQETKLFVCIYSTKLSLKRFIIAKIKPWFGIIYQVITICPYWMEWNSMEYLKKCIYLIVLVAKMLFKGL